MENITKDGEDPSTSAGGSQTKITAKDEDDKTEKAPSNDAEFDVTSEYFNPLKALYEPEYRVTAKEPKVIYQNMAAFETALKKVGISGLNMIPKNLEASGSKGDKNKNTFLVKEEKPQRRFQEHQMAIRTHSKLKNKHQRNLMMQIAQAEGPLKKLQAYVNESQNVKVFIRREHGIKGYVEGVLKMFDRHWNLLMVDVMECLEHRKYKYTEEKLVTHEMPQDCSNILENLGITLPTPCIKSLGRKRVEIKRNLPQLLLRGEHVVLISANIQTCSK